MFIPGICAFFFEPFDDVAECFEVFEALATTFAIKNDDGRAPEALAGYAPIGAMLDHFVHAVFAPGRNPLHFVNFREGFFAKRFGLAFSNFVHFDEPLFRGAEDDGIVATPAVWIAVFVVLMAEKSAAFPQKLYDDGIRGENVLAFVFGQAFRVDAPVVHRRSSFEIVFLAGVEVVHAVAGSSVNDAGALIECDVARENTRDLNRQERMLEFRVFEVVAFEF